MQSGLIKLENLLVIRDLQRERVLHIAPGWRFNFREAISIISGVHCNELNIDATNIGTFGGKFKKTSENKAKRLHIYGSLISHSKSSMLSLS